MTHNVRIVRDAITKVTKMLSGMDVEVTQRGHGAFVTYHPATGKVRRVNIPYLPDTASEELIAATQGFLDHEVAHALFTDGKSAEAAHKRGGKILHALHNIFEDCFIERKMAAQFRGSEYNLGNVRKLVFDTRARPGYEAMKARPIPPSENDWFKAMMVTMFRAWAGHPECIAFMAEEDKWALVPTISKLLAFFPEEIAKCNNSWETLALAERVLDVLREAAAPPPEPEEPEADEDDKDDSDEGEKSDDKGGRDESDTEEEDTEEEDTEEKDDADSDDDGDEEEDEDTAMPGEAGDDLDDEDDAEEEEKGEDEGAGGSDEKPEDNPETDDHDKSTGDDSDDTDGDGGEESDEEAEADDAEGDDEDDGGAGGDDEGDADEEGSDGDEEDGEDGSDDCEGDEGDGEGDAESSDDLDDGETAGESDTADEDGEGEPERLTIDEAVIDSILEAEDFEEMLSSEIKEVYVNDIGSYGTWLVFSREHGEPIPYNKHGLGPHDVGRMNDKVSNMIGPMSKQLERLILAQRRTWMEPGKRSGRLNPTALHRIKTGDDRVFRNKREKRLRNTVVSLLVDMSGSMMGGRIETAAYASYALSSMLGRVNIPFEVLGFTSNPGPMEYHKEMRKSESELGRRFSQQDVCKHLILKGFNERMNPDIAERFAHLGAQRARDVMYNNCDPESVEIAARRLSTRMEERKILMVLSDGQPAFEGDVAAARVRLKQVVAEVERHGIETVGIGIQTESVKHYYPKNVVLRDVADLPAAIMKEMRSLLLK